MLDRESPKLAIKGKFLLSNNPQEGVILIENGKIADILPHDIKRESIVDYDFINLPEDTLISPGFFDAHTHVASYGIKKQRKNYYNTQSKAEFLEKLSEDLKNFDGEYFIGEGLDQSKWKEKHLPTKEELDGIEKRIPVIIRRICGHIAVANSKALEKIITDKGVNRKEGILLGYVPLNLEKFFPTSIEDVKMGILLAQEELLSMGITGIGEIGSKKYFIAFRELDETGLLKLRVSFYFYEKDGVNLLKLGLGTGFGTDNLRIGGVKFFLDGSVGAKNAAFFKPYKGERRRGKLNYTFQDLKRKILAFHEGGIQTISHAIGDRANFQIARVLKEVIKGGNYLRHRVEHAEFIDEETMEIYRDWGIILSMQPNFVRNWGNENQLYHYHLGEKYIENNRFNTLKRLGVRVCFGSDGMPYGPLYGIVGALLHPNPKERIRLGDAIVNYTQVSSYASFWDDRIGKIAPGMDADLVILKPNPFLLQDSINLEKKVNILEVLVKAKLVKKRRF